MRTRARIVGALLVLVMLGPARAAGPLDDLWAQPDGAIAWWVFDPRAAGPGAATDPMQALAHAGLRALLARAMPLDPAPAAPLSALLTPGVLGASPYRACLLELEAETGADRPGPDVPAQLMRLAAVVEIRARAHDRFIDAVRAALDPAAREQPLDLPGGMKGITASRPHDAAVSEVSWCSTPTAFLVGFGRGALEKWLRAAEASHGEAAAARRQIAARRGPMTPVLEGYVNLNALRTAVPEQFAYGRIGRLADGWRLANARVFMVTAGLMRQEDASRPRLLAVDVAFSSRAERPGTVRSMPVTEGAWPADWTDPVAPAPYAVVIRANWQNWVWAGTAAWAACSPKAGAPVFAARERWMRRHGRALDRLTGQAGTWVVIRGGSEGETVRAQFNPPERRERVEAHLREVFGDLDDEVRLDPRTGVWSLLLEEEQADPDRMLRRFFWGRSKSGSAMVGAWGAAPVEAAVAGP